MSKKVTAFLTDDGKIFLSREEANKHEVKLTLFKFITNRTSLPSQEVLNLSDFLIYYYGEISSFIKKNNPKHYYMYFGDDSELMISITLVDPLNPSSGYTLKITRRNREEILFETMYSTIENIMESV